MQFISSTLSSIVVLFGVVATGVQAASISLIPTDSTNIAVGDVVSFELYADASDVGGILAGGLDLFYNSGILSYNGDFAFDAGFLTDPFYSRLGDNCATSPASSGCGGLGEINGIGFGSDKGLAASGSTLVGSLSFTGTAEGISALTMADNDLPAGSWYDNSTYAQIDMGYNGSSVTVSAVPVPAAAWLFGAGLLGLAGVSRRRG